MADNVTTQSSAPATPPANTTFRGYEDAGGVVHFPVEYVSGGSAGAWTCQYVDPTHGLPVAVVGTPAVTVSGSVAVTGTFWQATQPVSGTVTANVGTTNGLALDSTLTGGTAKSLVYDGTNTVFTTLHPAYVQFNSAQHVIVDSATLGTVTVGGTVTANAGTNLNTSALALDTSINGVLVTQGSTTSGEKGPLVQGAVTTAAPAYTTAQTSPLSLTTAGLLRVDGSGVTQPVSGTFWQATQPVSGTVTANAGTNLNTSLLALESGGNLATLAGGVSAGKYQVTVATALPAGTNVIGHVIVDSGTVTNLSQLGGVAVTLNKGASDVGTQRVTLGDGTQTIGSLAANQSINNAQVAGTATTVNKGASDAGTQRVTLGDGAQIIGSLAANQSVNLAQVGGAALAEGQTTMSASVPVAIASDQAGINTFLNKSQSTGLTGTGTVSVATNGCGVATLVLSGNGSGMTFTIQGRDGAGNWQNMPAFTFAGVVAGAGTSLSANGAWVVPCAGFDQVRANLTAIGGGTATFSWMTGAGTALPYSVATPFLTDGQTTPRAMQIFSCGGGGSAGDGNGNTGLLAVGNVLYNGSNADRQRSNTDISVFASAARTTAQSSDQTNYNGRGVRVVLSVTVASGTGGLTVHVRGKDSISGNYYDLLVAGSAVAGTGTFVYDVYPGVAAAANGITLTASAFVPRNWNVQVAVGDASSYTYSVSAVTIL